MIIEDSTVTFRSEPLIYERERDGQKPNTTRIIETEEWSKLINNFPRRIRIFTKISGNKCYFERKITDIMKLWQMFDKVVVTISWQDVIGEMQDEKG